MADETLIFDGACPLCAVGARWAAAGKGVRVRPYQAPGLPAGVDLASCRGEMKLVRADGEILSGAEVLPHLLARRAWTRPAARFFRLPGVSTAARAVYGVISRNRRAIAPTQENVRLPATDYHETPRSILAFLAAAAGFAVLVTAAYGASAATVLQTTPAAAALRVTAFAVAGWALSLPLLLGLGWNRIAAADVARQGACVMVLGALPLLPAAAANFVFPSFALNAAFLAAVGLLTLAAMMRRMRTFGLPFTLTALWFAALTTGGAATWWLMMK